MRYLYFIIIAFFVACQNPLNVSERISEIDVFCTETENCLGNCVVKIIPDFNEGGQKANLALFSNKTSNKPILLTYISKDIEGYALYFYFNPHKQELVYVKEFGIDFTSGNQYERGFYYSHKKNIKGQTRITNCNHADGEHSHSHNWEDYTPTRTDDFRLNYAEINATAKQLINQFDIK